jgi:hypothetical protein
MKLKWKTKKTEYYNNNNILDHLLIEISRRNLIY